MYVNIHVNMYVSMYVSMYVCRRITVPLTMCIHYSTPPTPQDLPTHVRALRELNANHANILQTGDPEEVAARQLFGCETLPESVRETWQVHSPSPTNPCGTTSTDPSITTGPRGAPCEGSDKVSADDTTQGETDMRALVRSMRQEILGKMQGRLGQAPPLVVPTQGSYWRQVLRDEGPSPTTPPSSGGGGGYGFESRRSSKELMLGEAQVCVIGGCVWWVCLVGVFGGCDWWVCLVGVHNTVVLYKYTRSHTHNHTGKTQSCTPS